MAADAEQMAATYFTARKGRDFTTFRSVMAGYIVFDGPLGHTEGGEDGKITRVRVAFDPRPLAPRRSWKGGARHRALARLESSPGRAGKWHIPA